MKLMKSVIQYITMQCSIVNTSTKYILHFIVIVIWKHRLSTDYTRIKTISVNYWHVRRYNICDKTNYYISILYLWKIMQLQCVYNSHTINHMHTIVLCEANYKLYRLIPWLIVVKLIGVGLKTDMSGKLCEKLHKDIHIFN